MFCKGIRDQQCVHTCIPGLVSLDQCARACVLGLRLLGRAVGEVFELLLVDLSDDGLVCGRQHGILLGEVLVEVIHISFGFLQTHTHTQNVRRSSFSTIVLKKQYDSDTW